MTEPGVATPGEPPRTIAFYLPQFHPVPENDAWWEPGFTEWFNVVRARPLYDGHYQPHLPGELGFYDLRLPETRVAQARLAAEHGISGFCYYHYWFGGRQLLGRPFEEVLRSGEPDFPFCLCWANENWTRTWDAGTSEVLAEQRFDPDDDLAHIRWLVEAFRDPRYIRVQGRPLLLVYRPQLLPDAVATFDLWRKVCADEGLPEPYLCKFDTHEDFSDPAQHGCDAAAEFLPHGIAGLVPRRPVGEDPERGPDVFDYTEVAAAFAERSTPPWRRYSCVVPGWDNTPRRSAQRASLLHGADPAVYEEWLRRTLQRSAADGRGLVFVNAWNEWAEGAHLEPDQRFGRAFLEATRRAVAGCGREPAADPAGRIGGAPALRLAPYEDLYHDLYQRYVALQRLQSEQLGLIQREAQRALQQAAAETEEARRQARVLAARVEQLEAALRRDVAP